VDLQKLPRRDAEPSVDRCKMPALLERSGSGPSTLRVNTVASCALMELKSNKTARELTLKATKIMTAYWKSGAKDAVAKSQAVLDE
jgi:hypothetical protein